MWPSNYSNSQRDHYYNFLASHYLLSHCNCSSFVPETSSPRFTPPEKQSTPATSPKEDKKKEPFCNTILREKVAVLKSLRTYSQFCLCYACDTLPAEAVRFSQENTQAPPIYPGIEKDEITDCASYNATELKTTKGMNANLAERLCPGLNNSKYEKQQAANKIAEIFKAYDPTLEFSTQCGYLNITSYLKENKVSTSPSSLKAWAGEIQKTVLDKLQLSISIGIGANFLLARVASMMEKPHGVTVIENTDESIENAILLRTIGDVSEKSKKHNPIAKEFYTKSCRDILENKGNILDLIWQKKFLPKKLQKKKPGEQSAWRRKQLTLLAASALGISRSDHKKKEWKKELLFKVPLQGIGIR